MISRPDAIVAFVIALIVIKIVISSCALALGAPAAKKPSVEESRLFKRSQARHWAANSWEHQRHQERSGPVTVLVQQNSGVLRLRTKSHRPPPSRRNDSSQAIHRVHHASLDFSWRTAEAGGKALR